MPWEKEEVWSSWDKLFVLHYTDLSLSQPPHTEKESLVAIFDNVVIPKLKNMAKSMSGLIPQFLR